MCASPALEPETDPAICSSPDPALRGFVRRQTFSFIADTMIGSDEGLREYLWNPQGGMKYALGSLASARYGRYLISILFEVVMPCT